MSTPFTIRITKDIIARAKFCGQNEQRSIGDNCAITLSLRDISPMFLSREIIFIPLDLMMQKKAR
jgi:hypothetical protein